MMMVSQSTDEAPSCLLSLDANVFFEGGRDYVHSTRVLAEFLRLIELNRKGDIEKPLSLEQLKVTQEINRNGRLYLYKAENVDTRIRAAGSAEARFDMEGKKLVTVFVEGAETITAEPGGWEQRLIHDYRYTGNFSGEASVRNINNRVDVLRAVVEIHKRSIVAACRGQNGTAPAPNVRFVYVKKLNLLDDADVLGKDLVVAVDTVANRDMGQKSYTSASIKLPSIVQEEEGNICFYYE